MTLSCLYVDCLAHCFSFDGSVETAVNTHWAYDQSIATVIRGKRRLGFHLRLENAARLPALHVSLKIPFRSAQYYLKTLRRFAVPLFGLPFWSKEVVV